MLNRPPQESVLDGCERYVHSYAITSLSPWIRMRIRMSRNLFVAVAWTQCLRYSKGLWSVERDTSPCVPSELSSFFSARTNWKRVRAQTTKENSWNLLTEFSTIDSTYKLSAAYILYQFFNFFCCFNCVWRLWQWFRVFFLQQCSVQWHHKHSSLYHHTVNLH